MIESGSDEELDGGKYSLRGMMLYKMTGNATCPRQIRRVNVLYLVLTNHITDICPGIRSKPLL